MEYASGGELFERICKAGRFGEDEVLICSNHPFLLQCCCSYDLPLMPIMFCCRHGSSSNNLYQGLASVMQWYISLAILVFTFSLVHFLPERYSKFLTSRSLFMFFNKASMPS